MTGGKPRVWKGGGEEGNLNNLGVSYPGALGLPGFLEGRPWPTPGADSSPWSPRCAFEPGLGIIFYQLPYS